MSRNETNINICLAQYLFSRFVALWAGQGMYRSPRKKLRALLGRLIGFFVIASVGFALPQVADAELTTGTVNFDTVSLRHMATIQASLSDGSVLNMIRTSLESEDLDTYVWKGRVDAESPSSVYLGVDENYLLGEIRYKGKVWAIELAPITQVQVAELDQSIKKNSNDVVGGIPIPPIFRNGFESDLGVPNSSSLVQSSNQQQCTGFSELVCDDQLIDILVLGSIALDFHLDENRGGISLENLTNIVVGYANDKFKSSGTRVLLNDVTGNLINPDSRLISINESPSIDLCAKVDAISAEDSPIKQLREEVSADLVVLLVLNSSKDSKGVTAGCVAGFTEAKKAFAVVAMQEWQSVYGTFELDTFTHEVGHLFNAQHDRFTNEGDTKFPSVETNFGYVDTPNDRISLMSYQGKCLKENNDTPCDKKPYFSTPAPYEDWDGSLFVLGDSENNNVLEIINRQKPVACYCNNKTMRVADVPFEDDNLRQCVIRDWGIEAYVDWVSDISCDKKVTSLEGLQYFKKGLVSLELDRSYLDGRSVGELPGLVSISLEPLLEPLTDTNPFQYQIKNLELGYNYTVDWSELQQFKYLVKLAIHGSSFSPEIGELSYLRELYIGNPPDSLNGIQNLSGLEGLDVFVYTNSGRKDGLFDSPTCLPDISNLTNLKSISLAPLKAGCPIPDLNKFPRLGESYVVFAYSRDGLSILFFGGCPDGCPNVFLGAEDDFSNYPGINTELINSLTVVSGGRDMSLSGNYPHITDLKVLTQGLYPKYTTNVTGSFPSVKRLEIQNPASFSFAGNVPSLEDLYVERAINPGSIDPVLSLDNIKSILTQGAFLGSNLKSLLDHGPPLERWTWDRANYTEEPALIHCYSDEISFKEYRAQADPYISVRILSDGDPLYPWIFGRDPDC